MVKGGRIIHGVGLLRVSQTPVTVDSEEYVVFVHGWLAPKGFASWKEANAYFEARLKSDKVSAQKRLRSGTKLRPGPIPNELSYRGFAELKGKPND